MIALTYRILFRICNIFGISYSFASDGEDYILLKYLRGIKNGCYIDIGSHKPIKHSVTFYLYLLGWKGVCVDPLPFLKKSYKVLRNKDLFINAGVQGGLDKNEQQKMSFFFYKKNPDNSTFDKKSVDSLIELYGRYPSSEYSVPVISVSKLLDEFKFNYNSDGTIHLLNLDTEGGELQILEDLFAEKCFPWFICVEELGYIAADLGDSKINNFLEANKYLLVSKTFLSSIYMKQGVNKYLPSPFVKGLNI